jgi:hypothetical protein
MAPDANTIVALATSSIPSWPWKFAVFALTRATSSTRKRSMSTSWMLCSSNVPAPTSARSLLHVDA